MMQDTLGVHSYGSEPGRSPRVPVRPASGGGSASDPQRHPPDEQRLIECLRVVASSMWDPDTGVEQPKRLKGITKKQKIQNSYFVGSEGVNWMRQHLGVSSREEAVVIGQELWEHGFISADVPFTDSPTHYNFMLEEALYPASEYRNKLFESVNYILSRHKEELEVAHSMARSVRESTEQIIKSVNRFNGPEPGVAAPVGPAGGIAVLPMPNTPQSGSPPVQSAGWDDRGASKRSWIQKAKAEMVAMKMTVKLKGADRRGATVEGLESLNDPGGSPLSEKRSLSGNQLSGSTSTLPSLKEGGNMDEYYMAEMADAEDIKLFPVEVSSQRLCRIKAASPDRLVEWLTSPKFSDTKFAEAFLLTYRSFMTPMELLTKLKSRFFTRTPDNLSSTEMEEWASDQQTTRIKVVAVLKIWMRTHQYDFNKTEVALLDGVKQFISQQIPPNMKWAAEQLNAALAAAQEANTTRDKKTIPEAPKTADMTPPDLEILYQDLRELAEQITLIEAEYFSAVMPNELMNKAFSANDKDTIAPNVIRMIRIFNEVSWWVGIQIISKVKLRERAESLKRIIMLADRLRDLRNYNGVMEVMSGLNSSPVRRLKKTWEEALKDELCRETYEKLEALTSHEGSYKAYRTELSLASPPKIPYLGVYLTDLTFIEDGNPDKIDGLINWGKKQMVANVIREISLYQSSQHYQIAVDPALREPLLRLGALPVDEKEAYEQSLKVEPRDTGEAIETLLMDEARLQGEVKRLQIRVSDLEKANKELMETNTRLMEEMRRMQMGGGVVKKAGLDAQAGRPHSAQAVPLRRGDDSSNPLEEALSLLMEGTPDPRKPLSSATATSPRNNTATTPTATTAPQKATTPSTPATPSPSPSPIEQPQQPPQPAPRQPPTTQQPPQPAHQTPQPAHQPAEKPPPPTTRPQPPTATPAVSVGVGGSMTAGGAKPVPPRQVPQHKPIPQEVPLPSPQSPKPLPQQRPQPLTEPPPRPPRDGGATPPTTPTAVRPGGGSGIAPPPTPSPRPLSRTASGGPAGLPPYIGPPPTEPPPPTPGSGLPEPAFQAPPPPPPQNVVDPVGGGSSTETPREGGGGVSGGVSPAVPPRTMARPVLGKIALNPLPMPEAMPLPVPEAMPLPVPPPSQIAGGGGGSMSSGGSEPPRRYSAVQPRIIPPPSLGPTNWPTPPSPVLPHAGHGLGDNLTKTNSMPDLMVVKGDNGNNNHSGGGSARGSLIKGKFDSLGKSKDALKNSVHNLFKKDS